MGFPDGTYHRGHLLASEFGAGMEAINLITMPAAVNQYLKPQTARGKGFGYIAELAERYMDDDSFLKGTLTQSGEIALPNYRKFEIKIKELVEQGNKSGITVSLRIELTTITNVTDIIFPTIYFGSSPILRFKIDNHEPGLD
ncbi:hypothetical protein [Arcanobacterium buesumense]|uniref:DNA/RNA non-specific endonuclease n=1 Tax=Arcanobacterium buesumense TaxID=2722751 RepID=A0A6H2ELJ8_9ACTO|nr:hypothetical protein [Arcanobacterium buesumense]QJC21947.1 hypothetical protein HC352_05135 [Arcanobacterium buesumense]